MTNWKKVKLGDVANFRNGKGIDFRNATGAFPVYGGNGIVATTEKYNSENETLIVGRVGAFCGSVFYTKQNCWVTDNAIVGKAKSESDARFLYYLLTQLQLNNFRTGSSQPLLNQETLNSIDIEIPDLLTQTRIASILSALDDKIELNRQMNHTLEQMAQALFKKYFVDDLVNAVALPEYIELNPKISIRKNELVKYVEMADLPQSGSSVDHFIDRPFNSGSKFQNHDTLLARITPCLENGKTGFVDFLQESESAYGSTEFIVMRAKKFISPYYVYFVARSDSFREHAIRSMVGTSGRQRVQTEMLNDFELNECDQSKMKEFHSYANGAFKKIKANSEEAKVLSQIRDNLLSKLMSGEIEIKEAETILA